MNQNGKLKSMCLTQNKMAVNEDQRHPKKKKKTEKKQQAADINIILSIVTKNMNRLNTSTKRQRLADSFKK